MSFIYCTRCNWEQDDFWDPEGYTPLRDDIIDFLRAALFKDSVTAVNPATGKEEQLDGREFVARELENKAEAIRNMFIRTHSEWRNMPQFSCPECGACAWAVD